jgi:hypothetical protein
MPGRDRILNYEYWRRVASETRAAAARCAEARERETLARFAEQYDKLAAYGESRMKDLASEVKPSGSD